LLNGLYYEFGRVLATVLIVALSMASQAALQTPASVTAGAPSGGTVNLAVGYVPGVASRAPLFVALDEGILAKRGLNVTLVPINPTVMIAALGRGDVQIASIGAPAVINADLSGASVVLVAANADYPPFSLYVPKNIAHLHDLVGKTVGVTAVGVGDDLVAKLFFSHFGLLGKIQTVATGGTPTTTLAALLHDAVTGAVLSAPGTAEAAKAGFVELINGIKLGVPFSFDGITVTRAYLGEQRNVVERFLAAHREAWAFLSAPANESAVEKVLARYLNVPPDVAKISYDYYLPLWTSKKVPSVDRRGVANVLRFTLNPKAWDARPEEFFDNSIILSGK
jgi:ABC-type nitrate/sulfonate/bicarbonate transport system substrate-binding protein